MKVKVMRNTRARGKILEAGKEYELEDTDAKYLIQIGKAEVPGADNADTPLDSDRLAEIVLAIDVLDSDNKDLWTGEGKPQVKAIENELGFDITADERDAAWEAFNS